jgi:hypothetical protein
MYVCTQVSMIFRSFVCIKSGIADPCTLRGHPIRGTN